MAFFGLFKSKQEKNLEAGIKGVMATIFPLGELDISLDCQQIYILTNGQIPDEDLRGFVIGCKTLVAISTTQDDDGFVRSNILRSKNRINEIEARDVYVYLAGESMYRARLASVMAAPGAAIPSEMVEQIEKMSKVWANGTVKDQILGGVGEFGMSANNPIPTVCVSGSNVYLSRLRFNGRAVKNKRLGSTSSQITQGSIDIYQISQAEVAITKLYICPYHRKDSKFAPKGFTLDRIGT